MIPIDCKMTVIFLIFIYILHTIFEQVCIVLENTYELAFDNHKQTRMVVICEKQY